MSMYHRLDLSVAPQIRQNNNLLLGSGLVEPTSSMLRDPATLAVSSWLQNNIVNAGALTIRSSCYCSTTDRPSTWPSYDTVDQEDLHVMPDFAQQWIQWTFKHLFRMLVGAET
ncbi:hypothetical protein OPV22_008605 [Ensete ventricosum]|uniref:Uncharacterized protein n=1 Tax=Ensete ventricosum TaxID=4639 RepID=A0AAV8R3A9_ENSVE|nr:hypothetical protein OPV22_008605 [Ensete ventricosum]